MRIALLCRWIGALSGLAFAALAPVGCSFDKEPLRSGWLASGVYAQPPPPGCASPRAPGRPFDELTRWTPPRVSGQAGVQLSLPWLGSFAARSEGANAAGQRHRVSSRAAAPVRIVEDRVIPGQVPGHVAGIDLSPYRRVAFIADTSGWMCDYAQCPDGSTNNNLPAPLLAAMGDQIDAAVAGLRPDQSFVVYAGDAWREIRFSPTTASGRALAGQFVRGQVCSGARGVRGQLLRALPERPDVVVVLTDGAIQRRQHTDYERRYEECGVAPSYQYCYVDEATEVVNMRAIADGAALPPVIAVTVRRHNARWLQNLAEATGGVYVDVAP